VIKFKTNTPLLTRQELGYIFRKSPTSDQRSEIKFQLQNKKLEDVQTKELPL